MKDEEINARLEALREEFTHENLATRFWMMQLYSLIAGPDQAAMANWVKDKIHCLKNTAPPDDHPLPAQYDAAANKIVTVMISQGELLAADLDQTARMIAAGEADPPYLRPSGRTS